MSVLFSKSCTYAIHATLFLSAKNSASPVLLRDISRTLKIPQPFLSKVLQKLVHDGILASHKGSGGGFNLARPAQDITVRDIMQSIDGSFSQGDCLLGFAACTEGEPCALHINRSTIKDTIDAILSKQSIASLRDHGTLSYLSSQHQPGTSHERTSSFVR